MSPDSPAASAPLTGLLHRIIRPVFGPDWPGVDRDLTQLLGTPWQDLTEPQLRDRLLALPVRELARVAVMIDLDPAVLLALVLARPLPQDDAAADAWELHALLLHVGGFGISFTAAAEALHWDRRRTDHAAGLLAALVGSYPHYELVYHPDGRIQLRPTGHGIDHPDRLRAHLADLRCGIPLDDQPAAILYAIAHYTLMFPHPELPDDVITSLLASGHAIWHTDGTLALSPDVELSTSIDPLPPPATDSP